MPKRFPLPDPARSTDNLAMPSSLTPQTFPRRAPLAHAIAALAVQIEPDAAGAPPSVVRMIPAGKFRSVDGRPADLPSWRLDAALAAPIVAASAARRSDYCIDYEHQTLLARENGKPAPAAGWYRDLEWREDGLYATDVRWTPAAAQMINALEYRYISPVFAYDRDTGDVRHLACAALVSNPGLDGLTDLSALAAQLLLLTIPKETVLNETLKKLLAALGLLDTATEAEALAAVAALKTHVAALSAHVSQPDPARYVPIATLSALQAEHADLQGRLAALGAEVNGGKLERLVSDAMAAGKLTPATEAWARELGKKDIDALAAFIAAAPVVLVLGQTQTGGQAAGGDGALSATELAVCSAMGLNPDDYRKTARTA